MEHRPDYCGVATAGQRECPAFPASVLLGVQGNSMNYYEHHIGDYDSATAHLSAIEDGIYSRMLRLYYRTESALPADLDRLCRLLRVAQKSERSVVELMLSEFFALAADGWHNARCDEEIARYRAKSEKARRSANARWGALPTESEGNANAYANALPTESEGNAPRARPQSPVTSHQEKQKQKSARSARSPSMVTFDQFEQALPDDELFVPVGDPIFAWADEVKVPREFLTLAYAAFVDRYSGSGRLSAKRYADWRRVFRSAVKDDWLKIWRTLPDGSVVLTTVGEQLKRQASAAA